MRISKLIQNMREFFEIDRQPQLLRKLGFGRKIVPVYAVNGVGEFNHDSCSITAVQNQWYDVLNDGALVSGVSAGKKVLNVELYHIVMRMNTLAEDLELAILIDGESFVSTQP